MTSVRLPMRLAELHSLLHLVRARFWRPAGIALLLALLGAQVAGEFHFVAERHVVCAEHGDVVDGDACGDTAQHVSDAMLPQVRAADGGHGDHHCAVLGVLHRPARSADAHPVVVLLASRRAPDLSPRLEARTGKCPVYRFAPKQSPPSA